MRAAQRHIDVFDDVTGIVEQTLPRGGKPHAVMTPREKRRADIPLEAGDETAERRLRYRQPPSRSAEM